MLIKSWQEMCSSIENVTTSSEMWNRMRWIKDLKLNRCLIDRSKAESLVSSLASDYICVTGYPLFCITNSELSAPISASEPNNCSKLTDTAPEDDNISYSMIKNLPNEGRGTLVSLHNRYLESNFVQWRNVKIVPIPKAGTNNRDWDSTE